MKNRLAAFLLLALPVLAQDDRVFLNNGTVLDKIKVTSFDIRELKYTQGGTSKSVSTDQVGKVDLAAFNDTFRLGLKDPGLMVTKANEVLADKEALLGQLALVAASAMFFDNGQAQEAVSALDDLQKSVPNAGVLPEVYRQKFEYYMGQTGHAADAGKVAKKYLAEAQGSAWPQGLITEAEFFVAMADRGAGGNAKDFQGALRGIIARAGDNQLIANRASVQLANSLRETKDVEGAKKLYQSLVDKDGVDSSSRAGAYLGLGQIVMEAAGNDADANRRAMLLFLRVYLETKDAWPSLQAEALYNATQAAGRWKGADWQYIQARCRGALKADFPKSDWTQLALSGK
ncbi:MAG: hypothetical protein U1E73_06575 [Planctomycetota bacterium]